MRRTLTILFATLLIAGCVSSGGGPPAQPPPSAPALRGPVSEFLGLSSQVMTGSAAADVASRAYELGMNQAAGMKYLRKEFRWNRIEPSPGTFNFVPYDTIVLEADAYGLQFIGMLGYGNPWASSQTTTEIMYPPDDPADFARFASMVALRYKDYIHLWELWNEQNAERFWKPAPDPEAYGNLLKSVSIAIHSVDPDAKIALGGLAPVYSSAWENMWGFLEEVFAFHPDMGDYFDVLAIHTYTWVQLTAPETGDPVNPLNQSVPQMISDARDALQRWGYGDKPIWITEMGYYTAVNDPLGYVTYEDQARYLARSLILSIAYGVDKYCWYTFRDNWDYLNDSEDAFGLVEYDPDPADSTTATPKPAYYAYKTIYETLGDTYYSHDMRGEIGLSDTQYAYRFTLPDGSKTVTALWTTDPAPAPILLPTDGGATIFTEVDMLGVQTPIAPSAGYLDVNISQSPVYIAQEN